MAGSHVHVRLLGRFGVEVDGRVVAGEAWRQRRPAAVVQMLALAPGHRRPRDQVVEALWPGLPAEAGAANLRKAAHRARRALGVDGAVTSSGGIVELLPDGHVSTDVEAFEQAARRALAGADVQACRDAVDQYTGDLLPEELYEPWTAQPRERLRRLYLAALAGGRRWEQLVAVDPLNERAHREVVRTHLQAGDRPAAIRAFDRLRVALREELGVSPDPESIAVYEQVLATEGRDVPTPAERARALLAWGVVHWERADLAEAEQAATDARALAIDAGLGRELADASELLGLVAYAQGRWRELFASTFLDALHRDPQLTPFVFDANMCMSEFALDERDGVQATAELADELLAVADESGSDQARALGLLLRGEATLLGSEEPDRAQTDLAEAARLHEAAGSTTGWALATERLAQAEQARGNRDAAARLHSSALDLAAASSVPSHLVLFVYGGMLDGADGDIAVRIVADGEHAASTTQVCEPCSMAFRVQAAVVCARTGELDRAHDHLAHAERIAQMWQAGPWHAAVAEARAALCLAEGAGPARAAALLRQAADGFAGADRPQAAARCLATVAMLR